MGKPRLNSVTLVNTVLVLAAVGGAFWAYQIVHGPAAAANTGASTSRTRLVAVTQGTVAQTVTATGSVASAATANANFTTSGTVTEVDVKVGDVVTKGQTLAKVDPTAANASLSTAKANLTAAQAALTRDRNNSADDATIASAQAQVATAQANVTSAQTTVNGTVLAAPIAGTVTAVSGAVGSSSGGSSSSAQGTGASSSSSSSSSSSGASGFVQLADLTKLQINASFAEADATKLKAGQTAGITWSALSGTRATGKVATISPTATTSNNVNSYAVTISLDSLPEGVRLGQSTTAVVTIAEAANVLRIPSTALRTAGGQRTVQVSVNGVTEERQVEVGITGGGFVEVKSGLQAGEQVVITTTTTNSTTGTNNQFPGGGGGFTGGGGGFTGGGGGFNGGGGGGRGGN
ncbi:efflux RND transporter periplasmic adaptor subunit [Dactylosporangium vinaceum]|uniref:Efflux RND transporter periplasmic adaptor subunit n=1 Tax=Dactylosporangium vinaceum TaxID=53362 RepID=A0ABV5MPG4_9ACTN|nr:HlyD family efflux transporter periplasmic adaptor subunit [Dactylosporangium vinaceum]UAB96777.1 efflux RND transporter periplasmic adaptor subunit [Dactylosporangium vinaceum]